MKSWDIAAELEFAASLGGLSTIRGGAEWGTKDDRG